MHFFKNIYVFISLKKQKKKDEQLGAFKRALDSLHEENVKLAVNFSFYCFWPERI
jgi:hypothetical protein